MRRIALLGLVLPLSGCAGFGHFVGDQFTWFGDNPNAPIGDSENMLRARGNNATVLNRPPVLPQPGDVWPSAPPATPSLSDLEHQANQNQPNAAEPVPPGQPERAVPSQPRRQPRRGSSTPPGSNQPGLNLPNTPLLTAPPAVTTGPQAPGAGQLVPTPEGPVTTTGRTGRVQTTTPPPGGAGQGILIPNGNGTSTLILPNGTVQTVPTPK